jgi:hypothetical protein
MEFHSIVHGEGKPARAIADKGTLMPPITRFFAVATLVTTCVTLPAQMLPKSGETPGSLTVQYLAQNETLSVADLKAYTHVTVTVHNPHTNADETYSGVPLIDLLVKLGAPHGHDLHGKALSDYIVATGADGYKSVLALAEADPDFHPGQILVADQMDGKPLDDKTGPFRLVVTEDKRPARSVHSLVSIAVKAAE